MFSAKSFSPKSFSRKSWYMTGADVVIRSVRAFVGRVSKLMDFGRG